MTLTRRAEALAVWLALPAFVGVCVLAGALGNAVTPAPVHVQPSAPVGRDLPLVADRSRPLRAVTPTPRHRPQGHRQRLTVTAYCESGRTASGAWTRPGTAAANRFPFGTRLLVPVWGTVEVTDRSAIGATDLDLFTPSCARALRWGRRSVRVEVLPR